jgi:predicted  nucleic acid-binding Zn-ribbon protein
MVDFADQFTRLESENVQLRKVVKASTDQVLEANKLAAEVQSENTCLKDELKKLKKKMKDEQEARHKDFIEADEKEGALRESIASLLSKINSYLHNFFSRIFSCCDELFLHNFPDTAVIQTSFEWTRRRMLFHLQLNRTTSSKIF